MSISSIYNKGNQQSDNTDAYFKSVDADSFVLPICSAIRPFSTLMVTDTLTTIINYSDATGAMASSFNSSTGEFTVPQTGFYLVSFTIRFGAEASTTSFKAVIIQVDGDMKGQVSMHNDPPLIMSPSVSVLLLLNAGQVVTSLGYQTGVNVNASPAEFNIAKISV